MGRGEEPDMIRYAKIFALTFVAVAVLGCSARTDKTDAGGVILSISHFDGLPLGVSASLGEMHGNNDIGTLTVQNIAKNISQPTSDLMNVEIHSYEVTYTREDTGTRMPPKLVQAIFGVAPVNGTYTLNNGPFLRDDQFNNQPLKDLKLYGRDLETGSTVVRLRVSIQFFGKTLSGDSVASAPGYFSIEVTQ
jgi:hypothetical protein